jgi:hypothetical protein
VEGHPCEAVPYLLSALENGEDTVPLRMMFWISKRHVLLARISNTSASWIRSEPSSERLTL